VTVTLLSTSVVGLRNEKSAEPTPFARGMVLLSETTAVAEFLPEAPLSSGVLYEHVSESPGPSVAGRAGLQSVDVTGISKLPCREITSFMSLIPMDPLSRGLVTVILPLKAYPEST
jgi:hypothetical protein